MLGSIMRDARRINKSHHNVSKLVRGDVLPTTLAQKSRKESQKALKTTILEESRKELLRSPLLD
jgi:hypothetical protein